MAIQNIKCPNCGGEVQLDDNLEKGFCMYCGGAIQIKEEVAKIKVEHSGKIEIDDSKKKINSLVLSNRAFESGNYEECYNYCCMVLECDINNYHATFRKGLSAAYLSVSRVNELETSLKTALEIIKNTSDNVDNDIYIIFSELFEYIKATYTLNCVRAKGFIYPNLAAVNNTFTIISILTSLCAQCSELISNEMISVHPTFENDKKVCLELGLELCEKGMDKLKYLEGYEQVKKGDRYVQEEVYDTAKSSYYDMQKQYSEKFKEDFNNLPTTRKALMEFDGEIEKLQKDIDIFNEKLKDYFSANADIKREYEKNPILFIVLTGLMFLILLIIGVGLFNVVSNIVYVLIMALLLCGFIGVGVLTVIRAITCSKARTKILNNLPAELSALRNVHDQSKEKLRLVKRDKASFVKKNVKK